MEIFKCTACGFVYNKESAECTLEGDIVEFSELEPEWGCPNCAVSRQMFVPSPEHGVDLDEEEARDETED